MSSASHPAFYEQPSSLHFFAVKVRLWYVLMYIFVFGFAAKWSRVVWDLHACHLLVRGLFLKLHRILLQPRRPCHCRAARIGSYGITLSPFRQHLCVDAYHGAASVYMILNPPLQLLSSLHMFLEISMGRFWYPIK